MDLSGQAGDEAVGRAAAEATLLALRKEIDAVDDAILSLINRRATLAQQTGPLKATHHLPIYDRAREDAIQQRLSSQNVGPLTDEMVTRIFREVICASRALQEPVTVAYLGPQGTFTHIAAVRYFGRSVAWLPLADVKTVFDAVQRDRADFGVVPIENSTEGGVHSTLDLLVDATICIYGEAIQPIEHHLLCAHERIAEIRRVASHPHAMAQCKAFLDNHLPGVPLLEMESTAHAAELARDDPQTAAIASDLAAQLYGLVVVKRRIEDAKNNVTRFLVLSKKPPARAPREKTSLLFALHDAAGALHQILRPFSAHRVNLTKIESRPSKKKAWEYLFYIDVDGHAQDSPLKEALEEIRRLAVTTKVLGAYPAASAPTT